MAGGGKLGEEREGIWGRELPKGEGVEEWMGGMEAETAGVEKPSGEKVGMVVVLGRVMGLERPITVSGGGLMVAATLGGGVGEAGGVVSIPLSSIIFSAHGQFDDQEEQFGWEKMTIQ